MQMHVAESFGRLLQRHRVASGLSQEDLAEIAGVSTNAISALERGLRHAPHSATLDLLVAARILGFVDARLAALETLRKYTDRQEYDAIIPALRDALGEDEVARLMALGSRWSEDQAVAEAMVV